MIMNNRNDHITIMIRMVTGMILYDDSNSGAAFDGAHRALPRKVEVLL